jgi:hypothetical protein
MLRLLDEALEAMLRDRVPLSANEIDVAFDAPNSDWSGSLIRPTVNLFLWAVAPSESQGVAGMAVFEENGRRVRRPPHPRLQCSYLVTAWTNDISDEHQLLGAVLAAVMREPEVEEPFLPTPLIGAPVTVSIARESPGRSPDFWSALGGKLKVGVDLTVTATMDASAVSAVGPPTRSYDLLVGDPADLDRQSGRRLVGGVAPGVAPGTVVRTTRGSSTTDVDGHFVVPGWPGDVVVVESRPPRQAPVPESGDVIIE